nr:retrovirus-related Pol polyprotein from transposon TNT 1-94 [Tanacetum cinerariifolium]
AIPTTSVSRPQLKSNPKGDRVLRSNSHGKKLEVEEHRVILTTSVSRPQLKSNPQGDRVLRSNSRGKKLEHDLCVPKSVAKPLNKTIASESNKKPRNNVRKLHEHFGKIYKWSYIKFTPSGYTWKPKSPKGNVNSNVSMPLGNTSRTANVKDTMTSRRSIMKSTCIIRDLKGNDLFTGTKFLNQTLQAYFAAEGIQHRMSFARTPEQNDVVKRQNRTLVEATRTMLRAAKVPLFF